MERVLVIQTAFLGDAILGSALLERIHADHPKCRIDYLVRKGNEGLFKGHPFLNDVLVLDKQRKLPELSRLLGIIRSKDYDAVLNAQRFAFSGILTAFSRARITVGYDRNPMSFLFDRKVAHRLSHVHEIDRLTDLYRVFSPSGQSLPRLYPTTEDEYVVSSYIKRPFITVAPASVWFTKQWPEARWAGFIGLTSPSLEVIITG
ncbi:MAG: glycosyltransferase family 9 protein, partial [Flavobacteriales bacterium]|nr:glycosyltransferase family 9 protein [Flavobacteriales bacterium]